MSGRVTVLQAPGRCLTKTYARDKGRIVKRQYDSATWFHAGRRPVGTVDDLAGLLRWLERRPDCCIIRGAPGRFHPGPGRLAQRRVYAAAELADDRGRFQKPARKGSAALWQEQEIAAGRLRPVTVLPAFEEQPTDWLLLDFDGVTAPAGIDWRADLPWTAAYLRLLLPAEFHAARCCYYATASAADLSKPDLGGDAIRMRLGFMLDRGVIAAEGKRWLAGVDGLDKCTLNTVQPIYTARPQYLDGLADPLPERLGMLAGDQEQVAVPELPAPQRLKREAFVSLGPIRSAEGLGLVRPHPRLDAALDRLTADAGGVRSGLMQAAFEYVADAGRDHVDIDALAAFLTETGEQYRTAAEVAGYGLEAMIAWVLERAPEEPPPQPHYQAQGSPADEAMALLRQEMAAAVGAAAAWQVTQGDEPPVVGIKAGAGIGKTGCALEQIAAIPGVELMNVEIYVPDHRLAEELAGRARGAAPGVRVQVIRGRDAVDTDGEPMCQKADLAAELGEGGFGTADHLCKNKDEACQFYLGCRHPAQYCETGPAIRIFAHAYMFVPRNSALPDPDLIVVDESFWRNALSHRHLALDRLTEVGRWRPRVRKAKRARNETPEERAAEAFAKAKAHKEAEDRKQDAMVFAHRVRSALEAGRDPRTVVTAEECELVAALEWGSRGGPPITPGMEYEAQRRAWSAWERDECAKAGKFWNLLAAEHQHPERPLQRIVLERDAEAKDGDPRHLLHLHYRRELRLPTVPVILLDADLNATIAGKFFPGLRMVDIPVRQQVDIMQIVDRVCSMRFLLGGPEGEDRERADKRLAELERFARRVCGLFVGYKEALDRIELPAGVDAVHLGNLRGRDTYKHHDVAVIAGRLEPPAGVVEDLTRAMFGDELEAIHTIAAGDHGGTRYPTEHRRYRMAGGKAGQAVTVSVHPDPRAQRLLDQIRERELEQAIARLRLVHRDHPAIVFLLTNLPLDLEVTTLTTWSALVRNREAEAVNRWRGVWPCSASERAKAAPDLWSSQGSVRQDERRKGVRSALISLTRGPRTPFPAYPDWARQPEITLVEYRYAAQRGSPHRAYIPGAYWCPDAAALQLAAVTGPPAVATLVGTMLRERPTMLLSLDEPEPLALPFAIRPFFQALQLAIAKALLTGDAGTFAGYLPPPVEMWRAVAQMPSAARSKFLAEVVMVLIRAGVAA